MMKEDNFSRMGVQIIIAEGGCRHFELLHWKHKVSKELATCRDKIAIIEYIYLTTIKPLKAKKEKEQSKLMQPSNYLLKKQQNSKNLISNRPTCQHNTAIMSVMPFLRITIHISILSHGKKEPSLGRYTSGSLVILSDSIALTMWWTT